ncbi:Ion channel [Ostertagia ostertagi]
MDCTSGVPYHLPTINCSFVQPGDLDCFYKKRGFQAVPESWAESHLLGALVIPLLHGQLDFFNGIYFAFICLTAIEYGDLVPDNNWYIPIVIVYVCIGLAISTIALDIGSYYVRKLHYIGQKLKNIANIRIWFGAKE